MRLLPSDVFGLFLLTGFLCKQGEAAPTTSGGEDEPWPEPFLALPFSRGTAYHITEGWIYSQQEWEIHGFLEHYGVDFAAERGTPILAAADGWAISSYHQMPCGTYQGKLFGMALGRFVQVWHPQRGLYTQYAHLERIDPAVPYIEPTKKENGWDPTFIYRPNGEEIPGWKEVKQGQVIGYMGDSGLYWGIPPQGPDSPMGPSWDEVHLHFEVYTRGPNGKKNSHIDPFNIGGNVDDYQDVSRPREGELWLRDDAGALIFADEQVGQVPPTKSTSR